MSDHDKKLLAGATRFHFGADRSLVAYKFGDGPLVVLVHGWSGRGAQLAFVANRLAKKGYQAVVFDAGAHGESGGRRISFAGISRDLKHLIDELGRPVYAIVGHSAGGMVAMAGRKTLGIRAERYVCVSAPYYPYPPIDALRKRLGLGEKALTQCKSFYAAQFNRTWQCLKNGDAYQLTEQSALLLIYDQDDDQVHHADAEKIRRGWPGAEVKITSRLGHLRALRDDSVATRIVEFVHGE